MKTLNEEQRGRLVEVLNEKLHTTTPKEIADIVGLSFGTIHTLSKGVMKHVPEGATLAICKNLSINPYYVLEGTMPKYLDWRKVFSGY